MWYLYQLYTFFHDYFDFTEIELTLLFDMEIRVILGYEFDDNPINIQLSIRGFIFFAQIKYKYYFVASRCYPPPYNLQSFLQSCINQHPLSGRRYVNHLHSTLGMQAAFLIKFPTINFYYFHFYVWCTQFC